MSPSSSRLYAYARQLPSGPKRFIKFLVVGAMGFAVDFGMFNLIHLLYDDPNTFNDELIIQAISFTCAVINNFFWNYFWIYPEAREAAQSRKIIKFIIVSVVGLLIRTPVVQFTLPIYSNLVENLHLPELPFKLPANLALATAVTIVLLWNFFVNRYWTYREVK